MFDNQSRIWSSNRRSDAALLMRRATMWTKPEFTEMRFGFEVTMYIYNR
jgi:coenzyme PQQ precursor peptide PqqA